MDSGSVASATASPRGRNATSDEVVPLPEAIGHVFRSLYPGRVWALRRDLGNELSFAASSTENRRHRFMRCLYFLRIAARMGLELFEHQSFFWTTVSHERFVEGSQRLAVRADEAGAVNAAAWFRVSAPYTPAMASELAQLEEGLGYGMGVHTLSDALGVRRAALLRVLEMVDADRLHRTPTLRDVPESVLREVENDLERRLLLRPPARTPGRPKGSFSPIQQCVVEILLLHKDPNLPWETLKQALSSRRGIKDEGLRLTLIRSGVDQSIAWSSLRDDLKRLRRAAKARLASRN